jgi:hypothetical protein
MEITLPAIIKHLDDHGNTQSINNIQIMIEKIVAAVAP